MDTDENRTAPLQRLDGVDFARGVILLIMIFYHLLFDLHQFGVPFFNKAFHFSSWLLTKPPYFIGASFFLLVGLSAWLKQHHRGRKRTFQILLSALGITLVSILFFPQSKIYFGVLHCIGITQLLISIFLDYFYINIVLGTLIVCLGFYFETVSVTTPWFIWLGFIPKGLIFADYYPLFPWFGVALFGICLGKLVIPKLIESQKQHNFKRFILFRMGVFFGRNSLWIYLLHQPILLTTLYLIGRLIPR